MKIMQLQEILMKNHMIEHIITQYTSQSSSKIQPAAQAG